jgi:hypothetical protein
MAVPGAGVAAAASTWVQLHSTCKLCDGCGSTLAVHASSRVSTLVVVAL